MINRVTHFDFTFKGVKEIQSLVHDWAQILYTEKRHENEQDGIDFYTDLNLVKKPSSSDGIIVTKWGRRTLDTCFHCITGDGLYDLLPWWREMQTFFEKELNLYPWLPFPCILISTSNLRRHADKGRPTAFNYPIIGSEVATNCLWHDPLAADDKYDETYYYTEGKSILIDTTFDHGGYVNPGYSAHDVRAICNMGFRNEYDECLTVIQEAFDNGKMQQIM